MIRFRKARSPTRALNDLDTYLQSVGTKPIKLLAREVQSWGEVSYDELADIIADGRLDEYLDWQARYAALIAGTLAPLWSDAITAASRKATAGKVVLFDSNDYVRAWIETHGGELITQLSRESQRAVAMVIMLGQSQRRAPRDIARDVRPLIGLTQQQSAANLNYKEKVYNRLREQGMGEIKARERSEAAALRYAGKQHRFRAETIVHTELAFAYNRGAHMGVGQAIAEGLMGRCAMKWTTAGTNRVCSRCLALKDTIVGYTDESGVTIPPLHPRCRCAIIYDEVAAPRVNQPKPKSPLGDRNYDSDFAKTIGRDHYDKVRDIMESAPNQKAAQVFAKYEDQIKVDLKTWNKRDAWQSGDKVTISLNYHSKGDRLSKPYQAVFHEVGHLIDWLNRKAGTDRRGRAIENYFTVEYKGGALIKAIKADFKDILTAIKNTDATALIEEKIVAGDFDWLFMNNIISYKEFSSRTVPKKFKVPDRLAYKLLEKKWQDKYSLIDRAELSDFLSGATKDAFSLGAGHSASYWKESTRAMEAFAELIETSIANKAAYDVLAENLPTTVKVFEEILDELLKGA